jgi:hypothetical protein
MTTYIQLTNNLNANLLTAGNATATGAKLTMQPPPNPHLNIELAGQKWSFLPDPVGSGAYYIVDPTEASVAIAVLGLNDPDGDPVDAVPLHDGSLWYLFADTHGAVNATGQPYCFLMTSLCMNPVSNYAKSLNVKGNSTNAGAGVDAFPLPYEVYRSAPTTGYGSQLWAPGSGEAWPIAPYAIPPGGGLQGNFNYVFGNDLVDLVRSISVTVEIEEDLICDKGVSFQFNGFGAKGAPEVWQQYCILLAPGATSLNCLVNNWTNQEYITWVETGTGPLPVVYDRPLLCTLPQAYLPKGTKLSFTFAFHSPFVAITGVTFAATGPKGTSGEPLFEGSVSVDLTQMAGVPGSILAYQFFVVGNDFGAYTTFTSGSGTITYQSSELISVSPTLFFQSAWDSDAIPALNKAGTGESSNMKYSFLPASTISPATKLTQKFQLSGYV